MTDPIVVTAVFRPRPGATEQLIDALREAMPAVHAEPGCLLYALHRSDDGTVAFIEKWSSTEHLDAHGNGEPVARLNEAIAALIAEAPVVTRMTPIPAGNAGQAAL